MCFFVPDELNCGTIVVTGSFNSWAEDVTNCATVEPVTGYDGWSPDDRHDASRHVIGGVDEGFNGQILPFQP